MQNNFASKITHTVQKDVSLSRIDNMFLSGSCILFASISCVRFRLYLLAFDIENDFLDKEQRFGAMVSSTTCRNNRCRLNHIDIPHPSFTHISVIPFPFPFKSPESLTLPRPSQH